MRIKYIIPFPFDEEGISRPRSADPGRSPRPDVDIDFVPVRNSCLLLDSYYESIIFDAYIAEAGLRRRTRATTRSSWTPCRTPA